ncbi:MAG: hypothetical protein RDU20_15275 [Desulfomonilaceae bacterium]|nr:hypothetical protein [Desulfomonilaceae bacterium]
MCPIPQRLMQLVLLATLFTWIAYPGWFNEWYSILPENYAWPASMSNQCDPRWGFWFW